MELFLDTVRLKTLEKYKHIVGGVTTNPGIMATDGATQEIRLLELAKCAPTLPISGEVIYANSIEQVCQDARKIAAIAPNVVVKIPGNLIGLSCIRILKSEGLKLNVTALMTFRQMALAAELGADYVSQFYRRAMDVNVNPIPEINKAREFIDQNKLPTKIIVGSVRTVEDIEQILLTRAHIVTANPEIIEAAFAHIKTQSSIDEFALRYEESIQKRSINMLTSRPI